MRQIDVITIFPGLFEAFLDESIVGIAVRTGRLKVATHDLRDWATGAVDILVVEDEKGTRQMIPAEEGQLRTVDIKLRRIVIEILPGLLDSA